MNHYQKLKELMVAEDFRSDFKDYPYSILLDDIEIDRDFLFLDPVLESYIINIENNPINDFPPTYNEGYPELNWWFHYQFFARNQNTCHSNALAARCWRLKSGIFNNLDNAVISSYLEKEFEITEPNSMISSWIDSIDKIISACENSTICYWSRNEDEVSRSEHLKYINDVIAKIDIEAYRSLWHLRYNFQEWDQILKQEIKAFRRSEAVLNRRRKQAKKELQRK